MSYGGFRVPNNSGGMAFQVKPDGSIKIGDTADDVAQVTGTLSVNGPTVFNEAGSTTGDFRVESNALENMLFVSAQNNRIGIGTASPLFTIDVQERAGIESVLRLRGSGDVGIRLAADSDNSGENDNPYIDFYQDGLNSNSRAQRLATLAMEGDAGATFTDSLGNAFFMDAFYPSLAASSRPLQLANASVNGGHKARITLEGTNGYVGIHTNAPTTPLEIEGTTKSTEYATAVGTQDLGTGTSSTLSLDAGIMLLDADSINGTDMGGFEVHTLNIPNGSTSGQRLTIIAQSTTNSTTIMPAGSINGSFGSLSDAAGTTALEFVWISEGSISAWYQVS
jgi:hypothetical protein